MMPAGGELLGYAKLTWAILFPTEWKHHQAGKGGGGGNGGIGYGTDDEPGTDDFYFLFPFAGDKKSGQSGSEKG
jgi:hypothetical protein